MNSKKEQQQFLYLTTTGWKTGKKYTIEIWFVSYTDKYYVMSECKEKAHWVQNIIDDPRVLLTVNSKSFEGVARIIDKHNDSMLSKEISNLMSTKYHWNEGLIVELIAHYTKEVG
jgi:deazaflavin-dependent oxidoreductase (nitroreductase family)